MCARGVKEDKKENLALLMLGKLPDSKNSASSLYTRMSVIASISGIIPKCAFIIIAPAHESASCCTRSPISATIILFERKANY